MDEQPNAGDRSPAGRPPATFTREELDAAEPEYPPSARRRWLIGFVIGALGSGYGALWVIGSPVVLLALTAALTPGGAGALVGAGVSWMILALILAADAFPDDAPALALAASNVVVLLVGLLATVVSARRGRPAPVTDRNAT